MKLNRKQIQDLIIKEMTSMAGQMVPQDPMERLRDDLRELLSTAMAGPEGLSVKAIESAIAEAMYFATMHASRDNREVEYQVNITPLKRGR